MNGLSSRPEQRLMTLDYTEFSFGYAFTENLVRSVPARPSTAPYFPNLLQEARHGYDVRIDLPGRLLFFQFKLPQRLVRRSAKEIDEHSLPGIRVPFFRMPLMRRGHSDQHARLMELEVTHPDAVFYATPAMHDLASFNAAYQAADVPRVSVFFSPREIGPLRDNLQHSVAYREGLDHGWVCSKMPREVRAVQLDAIESSLSDLFSDEGHQPLSAAIESARDAIASLLLQRLGFSLDAIRRRLRAGRETLADAREADGGAIEVIEELLVAQELARMALGVELLVAQPPRRHMRS